MKAIYHEFFFQKRILVQEKKAASGNQAETLFALANLFGIRIVSGAELVTESMIKFASGQLGTKVPEPFYRGFPNTVRELSPDKRLFDQIVHYMITYGFGEFSKPGHSLFENDFERIAFQENTEIRDFTVITTEEAEKLLEQAITDLLKSTRALGADRFELLKAYLKDYEYTVKACASKNTAIRLLVDSRDLRFAGFISLADVMKVADEINFAVYERTDIRDMNWRNQDRVFLTKLLDLKLGGEAKDYRDCYEKKALWSGLLHHIHYRPKTPYAKEFLGAMRGKENYSVYTEFEQSMKSGKVYLATTQLVKGKGSGALLRNLDYILSRCTSQEQRSEIVSKISADNGILLIQLYMKYMRAPMESGNSPRVFRFNRHNMMAVHEETKSEQKRRRTNLPDDVNQWMAGEILRKMKHHFHGRLGKTYIDPAMKNIALPLQEDASQGGFGVLPKGSRLPIEAGKKVRAFTYWELVNDIDLAAIGLTEDGEQEEFSWRTMAQRAQDAIVFSGDETSGFKGGSEFFDIDIDILRKEFPKMRYLVFTDNVYSGTDFDKCFCKAGYMMRDCVDSGEIYEPKTVESSFRVTCRSTFAYLFGIDLVKREFVWLNVARKGNARIAGQYSVNFLLDYFTSASILNLYTFFEMLAKYTTDDPAEAKIIVSDTIPEDGRTIIRSYDFEKIMALMQ